MYDELRKRGKEVIDEEVNALQDAGLNPEALPMYFGIAAEEILRTEKRIQPDLIIMGVRGLSTFKKFLVGSVSEEVTRKAKAPVLIVK
jgi:nucleotide-binding universal stress UspA family protein